MSISAMNWPKASTPKIRNLRRVEKSAADGNAANFSPMPILSAKGDPLEAL